MAQETTTPQETLETATLENAMQGANLQLVGTFIKTDGPKAMIRTSNGKMQMVEPGDKIGAQTVAAIEPGVVVLARGGLTRKLTLPGS